MSAEVEAYLKASIDCPLPLPPMSLPSQSEDSGLALIHSSLGFSTDMHELRPPETDFPSPLSDDFPNNALAFQMFMSELDSGCAEKESGEEDTPPSSPSPQLSTLECMPTIGNGLDDPFLMEFTDLDGLLSSHTRDPLSSECDLPSGTGLRPDQDYFFNFSDQFTFDLSSPDSTPPSAELSPSPRLPDSVLPDVVSHDHSYAVAVAPPTPNESPRKRRASSTSDSESPPTSKTAKVIVKDDRYYNRRQKNNVASQVSRAKRRSRVKSVFSRVSELEEENAKLRQQAEEMEAEAEKLKKMLVDKLAQ